MKPTIKRQGFTPKEIVCLECDGSGISMISASEGQVPITCPECQGSGKMKVVLSDKTIK